jgi:hypothetical protein
VRAAGRAILMLSDEIERLHIDLWHARDAHPEDTGEPSAETEEADASAPSVEASIGATLRSRLLAFGRSTNR